MIKIQKSAKHLSGNALIEGLEGAVSGYNITQSLQPIHSMYQHQPVSHLQGMARQGMTVDLSFGHGDSEVAVNLEFAVCKQNLDRLLKKAKNNEPFRLYIE